MFQHHVVAFFSSSQDAENAKNLLIKNGIEQGAIRLSADAAEHSSTHETHHKHQGFFSWLFGSDVPDRERDWYSSNLSDGRTALSVGINDRSKTTSVDTILHEAGAIEVERDDEADESVSLSNSSQSSASQKLTSTATSRNAGKDDEEVIPVINEELAVGKRTLENRRRVRTHIVERPVQGQVQLQEETVTIERRPVSSDRTVTAADMAGRDFEVIERHDEAVVEKRARAVEEIVVKKDVSSRTETINDKVRETKVEVEGKTVK